MKNTIYLNAKKTMANEAKKLKSQNSDKGYINYELNQLCDSFCRQFSHYAMKETISEKQANLYSSWLDSFTADLHP